MDDIPTPAEMAEQHDEAWFRQLVTLYKGRRHELLVGLGSAERFLKEAGELRFTTAEIRQQWREMRQAGQDAAG